MHAIPATSPPPPSNATRLLAPGGTLRASINLGNPILAHRDADGAPAGVSVDLARGFAARLGVGLSLVAFDAAAKSVEAVRADLADIGFFAIDPLRGSGIRFTAPYVLIEGSYLVPDGSAITDNAAVDRPTHRIAVGTGSAYDLFLSRDIRQARLVRHGGAEGVLQALHAGEVEVAAGIRQILEEEARRMPGQVRLLPGRFMVIRQAMGLPAGRGAEAAALLAAFVEEMKGSGFVAEALRRHKVQGATVAPPAGDGGYGPGAA